MKRMQFSGYGKEIRYTVLSKALLIHDKKVTDAERDGHRFTRSREVYAERKKAKREKRRTWFSRNGYYETVMFVEPTENSELRVRVEQAAKKHKVKVKVLEKSGTTVKKLIQKSNPFGNMLCERQQCVVCYNEDVDTGNINCRTRGCVYLIRCTECQDGTHEEKYRGQTGRSIHERMSEHFELYEKKDEKSILWKHAAKQQDDEKFPMKINVDCQCFDQPSRRLVTEAVMINQMDANESMNRKEEWNYVRIPRIDIV